MAMTISIEDGLEEEFSSICSEIGLTPSAAFGVFAKAVVRERRIPFELSAVSEADRKAWNRECMAARGIWEGYCDFEEGRTISRKDSQALRVHRQTL